MSTRRSRGAQPGNTNALKHGFYSRTFRRIESGDLTDLADLDLSNEINLLRVYIRRLAEDEPENMKDKIAQLNALSLAADRIATIAYRRNIIAGSQDTQVSAAFDNALDQVIKELNLS